MPRPRGRGYRRPRRPPPGDHVAPWSPGYPTGAPLTTMVKPVLSPLSSLHHRTRKRLLVNVAKETDRDVRILGDSQRFASHRAEKRHRDALGGGQCPEGRKVVGLDRGKHPARGL